MIERVVRLDEVCEINPRAPKGMDDDEHVSFLPMAAVSEDGRIEYQEARKAGEVKKGYTYFERGDVLLAKITPCFENGKAARTFDLSTHRGFGSSEFHVIRPAKELLADYIFYILWNTSFREVGALNMTGSAGQKRVPADFLKRLEIPLPPLDEQRRIAAILDKADALRQKRKQAIALLDSMTQAIFDDFFVNAREEEWSKLTVAELATNIRTGPFGSQLLHSEFTEGGIPVLGIDNVVSNNFAWRERRFISEEKYETLKRYTAKPMDILISIMGTNGRCAIVPENIGDAITTKHLCCITLKQDSCSPEYMHAAFLRHPFIRKQLGVQAKGAVMPGLNMGIIKSLLVPVPPKPLQDRFSRVIRHSAKAKKRMEFLADSAGSLFTSLQSRAFSGQL